MKKLMLIFAAMAAVVSANAAEKMTEYPQGKKAAIAFTFDDGTLDQYEAALPILEKHGVKAIFNVIPARVGGNHQGYEAMNWNQIKELVAKGHALGNHTWHHESLIKLIRNGETDRVREEIAKGHDLILENTGYDAKIVTFPGNGVNSEIEKIVSGLGYRCTPWRMDNWGGNFDGKKAAEAAEKIVKQGGYKFVLLHGVRKGGGWAALNDPQQLDDIITALKANHDLYVGGFQELLDYREKYNAWKKRERWLDEQTDRFAKQAIKVTVTSEGGWNAIRKCGDHVDFEVEFSAVPSNLVERINGGKAKLVVDNFGDKVIAEKEVDFVSGVKYTIGGTLDQPGFLRLTVFKEPLIPNFNDNWQRAVAFETERIVKTTPMPGDFDEFWKKARETAAAIPLDVKCEKNEKCKLKDHDEYRVSFAAPNGRRVYGYFRKPKDASVRAPLRVQVPGAGLGFWSMWPPSPKKGEAQLFMTVFPWEPWGDSGAQQNKYKAMLDGYREKYGCEMYFLAGLPDGLESGFYYPVILGIDRAVTWTSQQEGVDPDKVFYYGISQGGGFGLYLTYINPLIKRAVVNVPAFADMHSFKVGHQTTVSKHLYRCSDAKMLEIMRERAPYFDTANFAAKITKPIRFVTGQQDWVCPPHTVFAAYNACGSSDKDLFYTGGDHNSAVDEADGRSEKFLSELKFR